jgi:hypothetical protein
LGETQPKTQAGSGFTQYSAAAYKLRSFAIPAFICGFAGYLLQSLSQYAVLPHKAIPFFLSHHIINNFKPLFLIPSYLKFYIPIMEALQRIGNEDDLIDYVLKTLYANLHLGDMDLQKEILAPLNGNITAKDMSHIWEVLLATNLVNPSVGFGKSGKLYLTNQGMQLMKTNEGYKSYLQDQKNMQLLQALPALSQLAQMAEAQKQAQLNTDNANTTQQG